MAPGTVVRITTPGEPVLARLAGWVVTHHSLDGREANE